MTARRRVVRLLTTGGTIASHETAEGVVAAIPAAQLTAGLEVDNDVEVEVEEVLLLGSYQLQMDDLLHIARRVTAGSNEPDVVGVVVTHGTDTMEESAYFVSLFHEETAGPVVFTGAQSAFDASNGDGQRNLAEALTLAASPRARGLGVVIAMAGRAYPARYATKIHSLNFAAFGAPGRGACAEISRGVVDVLYGPLPSPSFDLSAVTVLPRVDIVPLYVGTDGVFVDAARRAGAIGVVLDAFGAGNANDAVLRAVQDALASGASVVVSSRCVGGPARPIYGSGGGADLAAAGAVFVGDLRALKARLLLSVALATAEASADALAAVTNYVNPDSSLNHILGALPQRSGDAT